ncbi:GntR family transcriptional regulator [Microbacterium sp. W1N]|uniref:GntR family transcriptional regulator n=1 Tax=Microbacterium festucae TaxID=2977531 RepID=UPI0021C0D717|nr:GntR family transcriptional regulator [Microbacterium festucae]MCT9820502.1 GntR family transcriptional regulator [Microbacterium festucae]
MADILYRQIADDLRSQIISGRLAPGDDLPSESELGQRWSTSRGPIRNALALLRAEGLVETRKGRPGRVRSQQAGQAVDMYVPFTTWARGFGRTPGAHTEHLALRRADQRQSQALGVEVDAIVVELVRLRLLDGIPAMLERTTFVEHVGRLLFAADLESGSITEYLAERGHRFARVTHEIDAVAADELDARLLRVPQDSPVLRLQRTSYDAQGAPFEFSDDRYRSDVVRFTVEAGGRQSDGSHLMQPAVRD